MFKQLCSLMANAIHSASWTTAEATKQIGQQVRYKSGYANRWMTRDVKRRALTKEYNNERIRLNAIRKDLFLPKELKDQADADIRKLPRDAYPARIHKRCVLTSRPRGLVNRYRLSRIQWRLLADYNKLSGVTRATW